MAGRGGGKRRETLLRDRPARVEARTVEAHRRFGRKAVAAVIVAGLLLGGASVALALRGRGKPTERGPAPVRAASFKIKCEHLSCLFNDTTAGVKPRAVDSREWSFGDGGHAKVSDPRHLYKQAGSYLVELVIRDNSGRVFRAVRRVAADGARIHFDVRLRAQSTAHATRVVGEMDGGAKECRSDALVERRKGKSWAAVDEMNVSDSGAFSGRIQATTGKIRARVPRSRSRQGVICEASTSNVVTLEPPVSGPSLDDPQPETQQSIPPTGPGLGSGYPDSEPAGPKCPAGKVFKPSLGLCIQTDDEVDSGDPIRG